jgi:hypothetical protein
MAKTKPNDFQRSTRSLIRSFINSCNGFVEEKPITPVAIGTEAWYRDRLAAELNGKTEVQTPSGRVDVLTKTEVIEVKRASGYKSAIGQVKCYGQHYPNHKIRIHLFGKLTQSRLKIIQTDCLREGIILSWE